MDSNGFITSIENHLVTLAPITKFIIDKQLNDLNVNRDTLTPEQALIFINRMSNALVMCLGKDGSQLARKMMIKQLRTFAPDFFEKKDI
jgi:hypothetical protein